MAVASQAGRALAQRMRGQLSWLTENLVREIQEAVLPGYGVFARPVLEQGARQIYEAFVESLEMGDVRPLAVCAQERGEMRRQQGVSTQELGQAAQILSSLTLDFAHVCGEDMGDVQGVLDAVGPLLSAFTDAYTGNVVPPRSATVPAMRSGGKRMTNRPGNNSEYESILSQLQHQTRQLETSARVSQQLTASLDLDDLLLQVVELIKSSFDYYHVHVYLLDRESGCLIMREGTGEVGETLKARGHRIELGRGMVGTVGQTGDSLLTADVSQQLNWLPNPLLPETRSELTVPLKIGDRVLGVLDVQSNEVGGLTETDLELMASLARQIAVAVQNAILFRETRAVSIISRAVSSGLGMGQVFSAISRELKAVVDFDYMTIATHYEIVRQVELIGVDDRTAIDIPLEEGVQLPLDLCIPGMAIQQQRPIIVPDLGVAPYNTFIDAEILTRRGMRSVLSVPLLTRGQVVATVNLVSARENAFTAADADLMEQISGQLVAALENAQIFENIQQMVEQRSSESAVFRAMVENASEAISLANVQQIVTYANPAFYLLHGYDPEADDLTRRSLTSFIVCEDEGALSDEVRDHILGGGVWHEQVAHRRKDGKVFQASTTIFAVRDEEGEPIAVAALIRDVTAERKIMAISQVASSTPDLDDLAPRALETIAADTDIDRAVLILYDEIGPDGPESMSVIAVYDPETGGRRMVDEHLEVVDSPFSTVVYHEQEAIWVSDVSTDERLFEDGRALLVGNGIVAMLALPILVRDTVVGMVAFDWRKHVDLPYDQIALYQVMVNQVSAAVENARRVDRQQQELQEALGRRDREASERDIASSDLLLREGQANEAAAMLDQRTVEMRTTTEVAQAIASALDLDELFRRVVTLVQDRFGYYHVHLYLVDADRGDAALVAGYGEPGRIMKERGHRIPLGKGLVGTAAKTGESVLASDVSEWENWLPNPLLPDTKSEVAVPIKMGNRVLGVLDVQDDQVAGLSQDTQLLLQGLCGQIAIAIENTRLLEEMQASLRQTALLLGLSTALSSLTEPQAIADALAKQLMGVANIKRCSVVLCSEYDGRGVPQLGQVYTVTDRDSRQRGWTVGQMYTLSNYPTLFDVVVCRREVLSASEVAWEEELTDAERALLQEGGSVSAVMVPMASGDRVLGYFVLQDREPHAFSAGDLELYRGIANQSATAFSNALSLREVQDRLDQVNMLYESSRAVSTSSTQGALTETIIQRIVSTNVDRCEILLYEQPGPGSRYLEVVGSWAAAGNAPQPGTRLNLREYPLAEVAQQLGKEGTCVISAGDIDQPDAVRQMCAARGIKALALVPLKVAEEYLGFLTIERQKSGAFGADVLRFYETVASQSAVALRNMQLIGQTQRQLDQLQQSYDDMARLADTVRELSSPVIQVWDDVLVLPLVGAIDSRRAMNMMEVLLNGITTYQAEQVIIDITGVPVMDTSVVNHLLQTIKAASLLGARCMLVGISSQMAQTIVGLGLDLSSITTYSNLRAGIQAALKSTGYAIAPLLPRDGEQVS